MKTLEQRIASHQRMSPIALKSLLDLDILPLWRAAKAAIDKDGNDATVRIGLRNKKRSAKTVRLSIGVTARVVSGGYACELPATTLLDACDDEMAAISILLGYPGMAQAS